jgi:diguanylate cyclase (GGDEF)-like protein/PAS domain S-box-containing protein
MIPATTDSPEQLRAENQRLREQIATLTQAYLQAETAFYCSEHQLRLVVERAPAAFAMFDRTMAYIAVSHRFCTDYHLGDQNVIGRSHYEIFPDIPERWKVIHQRCLMGMIEVGDDDPFPRADGSLEWVRWQIFPWYETPDTIGGLILFSEVITERKQMENALTRSEKKYRQLHESMMDGFVRVDMDGTFRECNKRYRTILGYTDTELAHLTYMDVTLERWHQFEAQIIENQVIQRGYSDVYEKEYCRKDGTIIPVELRTILLRGDHGEPVGMWAIVRDITERKRTEDALHQSEAHFRPLFEQTHDAVFLLDMEGRYLVANQRSADMLGYTLEEMKHLSVREISAEFDQSLAIAERLIAGEQIPMYERRFRKKDGQIFPVEISIGLVWDANGNPMHIQSVVRDISQRKQAEETIKTANDQLQARVAEVEQLQVELREQALHDPLTGLYNRRYLNEALAHEIQRAGRDGGAVSIILMDIDHFKTVNDTYGHPVGDSVLIKIARLITKQARSSDIICRYGGEEFLMILPGAMPDLAAKRADDIRRTCASTIVQHPGENLSVTLSFGVAAYPEHGQTVEQIITNADLALYTSKQTGRNRVTICEKVKQAGA